MLGEYLTRAQRDLDQDMTNLPQRMSVPELVPDEKDDEDEQS
jgi:hypothetical protein